MGLDRRHTGWILAATGLGLAFGLGWMLGHGAGASAPPPGASASRDAGLRPEDVELRLDAGGLTLMPDGGLELKPIEPPGAAGSSRPAASAPASATASSSARGPGAGSPQSP